MSATWIELDLARLKQNLTAVRQVLPPAAQVILGVEGNAYGHGLEAAAPCAWSCGVKIFQAAGVRDSVALRRLLPEARILVAGAADPDEAAVLVEQRLTAIVVSEAHARALARRAAAQMAAVQAHVEVDTGMGLFGFDWRTAADALKRLARMPGLRMTGLCSTFADSCDVPPDLQMARFRQVLDACRAAGLRTAMCYMADAAAMLNNPDWVLDGVRPGLLPYGYAPRAAAARAIACTPLLTWKARLAEVRDAEAGASIGGAGPGEIKARTRVGTVAAGFGDGVDPRIGGRGCVLVGGRRCPVIGRIELDALAIDLGPGGAQKPGDEVVLLGQQGDAGITAGDVAEWCGTPAAAVLTAIRAATRTAVRGRHGW